MLQPQDEDVKDIIKDTVKDTVVEKKEKVTKSKTTKVEVDVDVLKNLLDKVAVLEEKTNQIEQTSSQDQIRKIEALRAQGKLVKSVKVRRFDGGLVLGWKTLRDNVWVADGKLHEEQDIEVYMDDGTKKETTLLRFGRTVQYESYEVLKEARTGAGEIEFTLMLPDGRELVVNSKYVN